MATVSAGCPEPQEHEKFSEQPGLWPLLTEGLGDAGLGVLEACRQIRAV